MAEQSAPALLQREPYLAVILWALFTLGFTLIVTGSKITAPLRLRWQDLFSNRPLLRTFLGCPLCVGWWAGLAATLLLGLGPATTTYPIAIASLVNAFATAAWCWVVHVVLVRLGADQL